MAIAVAVSVANVVLLCAGEEVAFLGSWLRRRARWLAAGCALGSGVALGLVGPAAANQIASPGPGHGTAVGLGAGLAASALVRVDPGPAADRKKKGGGSLAARVLAFALSTSRKHVQGEIRSWAAALEPAELVYAAAVAPLRNGSVLQQQTDLDKLGSAYLRAVQTGSAKAPALKGQLVRYIVKEYERSRVTRPRP